MAAAAAAAVSEPAQAPYIPSTNNIILMLVTARWEGVWGSGPIAPIIFTSTLY
jgi:hypothetical protein